MKTPYQTTFDEQVSDLTPEMQAVHRRIMVRGRKDCRMAKWWFEQARQAVDKAPEPKPKEQQ